MYKINFQNKIHVYFIGIGGISMSGMAELLHSTGFTVSGSDSKKSEITKHLESLGITIFYGQASKNITPNINLVVYTAAVKEDNPEYQAAKALNLPMMDRAELVGQVMNNYENAIAVSGTHGKTTVTSMLSLILLEGNLDPTISVGGILDQIKGNIRVGKSQTFITEACEYTNSFLKFKPKRSIILNIEAEHLDFFKDIHDIRNSFHSFAKLLPADGLLVVNGEIDQYKELTQELDCNIITYGVSTNDKEFPYDICAKNISYNKMGFGQYDLYQNGTFLSHVELQVVGLHNISNSLAAVTTALDLKIPVPTICNALMKFTGTHRRFEKKGVIGGITIIDDYAHHPTEIEATLTSAKRYPHQTLWCVFQPHTYSRTKQFLKEFAQALSIADTIVLADIYSAREENPGDISSKDLMKELQSLGKDVHYFEEFDEIENFLLLNCTNGDLLITMGAGDIVTVGESLLGK